MSCQACDFTIELNAFPVTWETPSVLSLLCVPTVPALFFFFQFLNSRASRKTWSSSASYTTSSRQPRSFHHFLSTYTLTHFHTSISSHVSRLLISQPGSFTFRLPSAFNLLPELLCHFCTRPLMEHWVNRFIDTHPFAPTTYQFPVSTGRWFIPSLSLYVFFWKKPFHFLKQFKLMMLQRPSHLINFCDKTASLNCSQRNVEFSVQFVDVYWCAASLHKSANPFNV